MRLVILLALAALTLNLSSCLCTIATPPNPCGNAFCTCGCSSGEKCDRCVSP